MMSDQKAYGTVLLRAKTILDELLDHENGLTLKEISDGVMESKSTTLKVLNTMQLTGMLRRDEDDKRYYIGPAMIAYGVKAQNDFNLVQVVKPYLKKLLDDTNETVNLGVEKNSKIIFIDKLETTQNIHLNSSIGGSMEMYSSSMGKALLATKSKSELEEYFRTHSLQKLTKETITDKQQLRKQLEDIKRNKCAIEWGENQEEVVCVGASLIKNGIALGTFSVSVPEYRMNDNTFNKIKNQVVQTKTDIEAIL